METDASFSEKVLDEYYLEINAKITKNKNKALQEVKDVTKGFLYSTETYKSLVSGELAKHFGFRKGQERSRLEPILNTFIRSMQYRFIPFGKNKGGFSFLGFVSGFQDVLSLPEATIAGASEEVVTVNYPLPWLNWLLLRGDDIIVNDYKIEIGTIAAKSSRSGKAIMISGGSWAVPELSGTESNNWITKLTPAGTDAITAYDKKIVSIIKGMI